MYNFNIPESKKIRVILNTDLKNEVDDQFAMVHAILTQSFDLRGIIPAHFGEEKSATSQQDSYKEGMLILEKMGMTGNVRIENGAPKAMPDEKTPMDSPGARLIIEEAMKDDKRPLYIASLATLTDIASAILLKPEICSTNTTIVWIGGRDYPAGGWEYNLKNDVCAANVLFKSDMKVWQIPRNVYRMMPVTFAELYDRVRPYGEIGKYLAENVVAFNNEWESRPAEYRILGDSPSIGVMMFPDCGKWSYMPAPEFDDSMHYIHNGLHRPIRVYESIDARFILEDFYAKIKDFSREKG